MVELLNIDEDVMAQMYKLASINLSPNVPGQVAMSVLVQPPVPGDESYELWESERTAVLASLERRANAITVALNELEGVSCVAAGSLYAFPKITLPPAAICKAKRDGVSPDVLYCLELLGHAGIATTPGSGFGQKDGTYHFRTTILVSEDKLDAFVERIKAFHEHFMAKYKAMSVDEERDLGDTGMCRL